MEESVMRLGVDSSDATWGRRGAALLAAGLVCAGLSAPSFGDDQPARQEAAATETATAEVIAFLDPGLNASAWVAGAACTEE